LTAEQLQRYAEDGFLVIPGLAAELVSQLGAWTDELQDAPEVRGGVWKYYDDELARQGIRQLSRIEFFARSHAGWNSFLTGSELMGPLADILGEPAVLFKEKINFKLPGGSGFAAHQDVQAGWDRYCATQVSVMVGIDATTIENGCLEFAAGAHRRGLLGEAWRPLSEADLVGVEFEPYPTAPGDVVFFGSYTPHRSGPNRTDGPRRVLYLTYNPLSEGDHYEQYYADKRASYPPDIEREPGRDYSYRV
jgi:2-aminoethylphosphonate dioxygenase